MYYSKIVCPDIANGLGCRCTLFVSGCNHHCKGCFNKDTWDFNYGKKYTYHAKNKIIELLSSNYIQGLTILGGEPLEPVNQMYVYDLICKVRSVYPGNSKDIWLYTGCDYNLLLNEKYNYHTRYTSEILSKVDILVDGPFIEKLKDISLKFRGSSNQRIIKCKESINSGELILSELNS